jgi:hypothetical protein
MPFLLRRRLRRKRADLVASLLLEILGAPNGMTTR